MKRIGKKGLLVTATLVEEIQILDQEAEEGHDNALSFVRSAGTTPHRRFQSAAITTEVVAGVHLVLQDREFRYLYLRPLKWEENEKFMKNQYFLKHFGNEKEFY